MVRQKKEKKKETRTTKGYGSAAKGTYDNKYRYLVQGRIQGGGRPPPKIGKNMSF
jgi:hypothetical protein